MTHAGVMASSDRLTVRGILGVVVDEMAHRVTCRRRGHDPVLCNGVRLCRRCYRTLP